jgi:predicted enzyme related to lactoylglutathione lyase
MAVHRSKYFEINALAESAGWFDLASGGYTMQLNLCWYGVSDLEKAKAFYGDVLGMKKKFEMPAWVEFGDSSPDGVSVGLNLVPDFQPKDGGATVVFRVTDLEKERDRLAAKGAKFEGEIRDIPGVVRIATFRDPFGNRLQIMQLMMG